MCVLYDPFNFFSDLAINCSTVLKIRSNLVIHFDYLAQDSESSLDALVFSSAPSSGSAILNVAELA